MKAFDKFSMLKQFTGLILHIIMFKDQTFESRANKHASAAVLESKLSIFVNEMPNESIDIVCHIDLFMNFTMLLFLKNIQDDN